MSHLRIRRPRVRQVFLLALALILVAGCVPQAVTSQGREIADLYNIVFVIAIPAGDPAWTTSKKGVFSWRSAKGATPVVCSLIPRKIWQDGKIQRTTDSHADWARDGAKADE